ncbi:sugar ABC transporter permease [Kitasatospora sp. NPDC057223]|uniref:sugar ABC transporter permease n=1 Tax=Kitasatospora sp. NPDC057223 TaxID=3346055 RepID=UPI00362F48D9
MIPAGRVDQADRGGGPVSREDQRDGRVGQADQGGGGMDWAGQALTAVLRRVTVTAEEVGPRFPLYADPASGRWTTTGRGAWTGGFWAGLLWLRALASGGRADRAAARECTAGLAGWAERDTATRGLILWYGTALADGTADGLRERAAQACLSAFDPELGLLPWGDAFGGPRLLARADGVPGLAPLLARAGDAGVAAARSHLTRHLDLCLGEDPPRPAWEAAPGGGWRGCAEPAPGWSRTGAWLLLGVADGLALPEAPPQPGPRSGPSVGLSAGLSAGLWSAAGRLAALRLAEPAPPVPPAGPPGGPVDTSAAAIEAVAALKLAALGASSGRPDEAGRLRARAESVLRLLCERHLSEPGAARPAGMLLDGCYDADRGLAVRHELVWGDFFLALGLAVLTGLTGPLTV